MLRKKRCSAKCSQVFNQSVFSVIRLAEVFAKNVDSFVLLIELNLLRLFSVEKKLSETKTLNSEVWILFRYPDFTHDAQKHLQSYMCQSSPAVEVQ